MSVLVIGAYGSVGSHVVAGVRAAGIPVRGTSRTVEGTEPPDGVEMVRLDLDDPATLPPALDGMKKVFLYAKPEGVAEFVTAAQAAGVEHVVLLSSASVVEEATRNTRNAHMHAVVEDALQKSGMAWTFLRPTTFATRQLALAPRIRSGETLRLPFLQARSAVIHERDIADVGVRALTGSGHEGQAYWLTGPQALTMQEQIQTIGEAIGRPIETVEVAPEDTDPPTPEFFVRLTRALQAYPTVVTKAVEEATGVPARTFRQWAEDHVKDFS
ncbi:NAD(P)H-binding protein [Micromonospora sp. NBS 11-29]|uniref:NAD(P)H-binding protein n=1 Tax=Micromonospora sp. NBS 11-29 TaxID=1960879 RepID=UPI000B7878E4|nr:NAD(P)H-binding protein [Micromonospora sp. NBS 11-29]